MTQQYMRLSPVALAGAFAVAALVGMTLSFLPMQFSMFGGHGYGMMNGIGYAWGFGFTLFACIWVLVVSAIAGAIAAAIYNALLPRSSTSDESENAIRAR